MRRPGTPLVGRAHEIARIRRLVHDAMGGTGYAEFTADPWWITGRPFGRPYWPVGIEWAQSWTLNCATNRRR